MQLASVAWQYGLAVVDGSTHFLHGLDGFLIRDDPVVELDSDRHQTASRVIQNFAQDQDKQILIFLCHSAHADLLGDHVIHLEMPF